MRGTAGDSRPPANIQDKNQLGVSAGLIAGLKKTQFNGLDFGVLTVSTYAIQHN